MRITAETACVFAAAMAGAMPAFADIRSAFAYRLSDSNGELPLSWAALSWDPAADELYVMDSANGVVEIFNYSGMVLYTFGDDAALGSVIGVAPLEGGDIAILSQRALAWKLWRCNFRGEPKSEIAVGQLPEGFTGFKPTALRSANGKLYLADTESLRVLVIGPRGDIAASWDLRRLLKLGRKDAGNGMRGFNVDRAGNLLGTVPGSFLAFVVSPEGEVRKFGERGSQPGRFNVVAGIAADENGNVYVIDTLRAVVMAFDAQLKFAGEFGYRGTEDDNLIAPNEVAAGNGRVFVSQSLGGVKAFDVLFQ
jgi:DNA-binding beta-propeller fold protein YncE